MGDIYHLLVIIDFVQVTRLNFGFRPLNAVDLAGLTIAHLVSRYFSNDWAIGMVVVHPSVCLSV